MNRTSPALRAAFASLALLGLAGCGGGVYLELTDPYGPPPSISIRQAPEADGKLNGNPTPFQVAVRCRRDGARGFNTTSEHDP